MMVRAIGGPKDGEMVDMQGQRLDVRVMDQGSWAELHAESRIPIRTERYQLEKWHDGDTETVVAVHQDLAEAKVARDLWGIPQADESCLVAADLCEENGFDLAAQILRELKR